MKKIILGSQGFYLLSFAITVVALGLIGTGMIMSQSSNLYRARGRNRALYDAEVAIDSLGKKLRYAYEMAAPVAESNNATFMPASHVTDKFSWVRSYVPQPTGAPKLGSPKNVDFYIPNSKICVERGDFAALSPNNKLICLIFPPAFHAWNDLFKINFSGPSESFADAGTDTSETKISIYNLPGLFSTATHLSRLRFFINESQAQSTVSADPGKVADAPIANSVPIKQYNPNTLPFQLRYGKNNCTPGQLDRFCVTVQFCAKLGACLPTEMVLQTFVFMKAPQSSLFN